MIVLFSNVAFALYEGECWNYVNGTVCFNGTQSYVQLTGAKLNWSDILNPQSSSGNDDNNYTNNISFSNLGNTSTLTLGRVGMSSLTATMNWPFVSCSSGEYSRWNGSSLLCFNDGGDGNNYPTSLTFTGRTLTLGRNGLSDLTSDLIDNSTLVSCNNITGSASNLCTITQVVDTNDSARVNSINASLIIQTARIDSVNNSINQFQPSAYTNISALQAKPDATGGWTNTTVVTSTGLQVNITGLTQMQTNLFFTSTGSGLWFVPVTGTFTDGIFKPTTNSLIFRVGSSASGANRLQINATTGFVGIGVHEAVAPSQRLHVNGSLNITNTTYTQFLTITNNTAASCDLKADTNGNVYCGTDSTGGGGGTNYGILLDSQFNITNQIWINRTEALTISNNLQNNISVVNSTVTSQTTQINNLYTNITSINSTIIHTTGNEDKSGILGVEKLKINNFDSNPVIYTSTDTNTGIAFIAPDVFGMFSSGINWLEITSSGVGINGFTAMNHAFSVNGSSYIQGSLLLTGILNGTTLYENNVSLSNKYLQASTGINAITLDAGFNLTNVNLGLQNKTTLSCSNITGAASNLCTITQVTDTNGGWVNDSIQTNTSLWLRAFQNATISNISFLTNQVNTTIKLPTGQSLYINDDSDPLIIFNQTGIQTFYPFVVSNRATVGNLTINNLTAANCDVKADTNGNVFCGTDATGSGSSSIAWMNTSINTTTNLTVSTLDTYYQYGSINTPHLQQYFCDFVVAQATTMCYPNYIGAAIGTGGASASYAGNTTKPGVVSISKGTAANSGYRYLTEITAFLLNGSERYSTRMLFFQDTLNQTWWRIGFCNSVTVGTECTNAVAYNITNLTVNAMTRNAAGTTSATSTFTMTNGVWYTFTIQLNENATNANFTIYNDTLAIVYSQVLSSNIPVADGRYIGSGTIGGTQQANSAAAIRALLDFQNTEIRRTMTSRII